MSREEKIALMGSLNWDCTDARKDMLAVIEGGLSHSGSFDQDRLFVRSLEYLPWHYIVELWGIGAMLRLYTPENAARVWPAGRRQLYDFAFAVLRNEPLPFTDWGDDYFKTMWRPFLSDRWYGVKQGIL